MFIGRAKAVSVSCNRDFGSVEILVLNTLECHKAAGHARLHVKLHTCKIYNT